MYTEPPALTVVLPMTPEFLISPPDYSVALFRTPPEDRKTAPPETLDGVEVYNGNPRHDSRNALALAFARLLEKRGILKNR